MGDLKPCPFCGVTPEIKYKSENLGLFMCRGEPCHGSGLWSAFLMEDEQKAIAAWNRRSTPPEVTALVEALGKIAEEVSYLPGFDRDPEPTRAAKVARSALAKWEAAQK